MRTPTIVSKCRSSRRHDGGGSKGQLNRNGGSNTLNRRRRAKIEWALRQLRLCLFAAVAKCQRDPITTRVKKVDLRCIKFASRTNGAPEPRSCLAFARVWCAGRVPWFRSGKLAVKARLRNPYYRQALARSHNKTCREDRLLSYCPCRPPESFQLDPSGDSSISACRS